jgi:hypothetical protein
VSALDFSLNTNPTQKAFIRSRAKASLFAGRMREGKTTGLVWCPYYHTVLNPGACWVIARDTWTNLERTTQKEFFKWFPPGVFGRYKAAPKTFTWNCVVDGAHVKGDVVFMGMDDSADMQKLQSMDLSGVAFDEAAPALSQGGISEDIFTMALTRLSQASSAWHCVKLVENNPDEEHWTYKRFVDPGTKEYDFYQPVEFENKQNVRAGYYEDLAISLADRPDLKARFHDGKFGRVALGPEVTPEWRDEIHTGHGLLPVKGRPLHLLWDFAHNPTCVVTQATPMGYWNVLWCEVGEGIGMAQYLENILVPVIRDRFAKFELKHIGDPAGSTREQSNTEQSAVRLLQKVLGGSWRAGPRSIYERVAPLRACLRRHDFLRVDKAWARPVWNALRGGWHYAAYKNGVTGKEPVKDIHSHPGDAMGYGAAILFPTHLETNLNKLVTIPRLGLGGGPKVWKVPKHGQAYA